VIFGPEPKEATKTGEPDEKRVRVKPLRPTDPKKKPPESDAGAELRRRLPRIPIRP
jgi:hypothetical protein